MKRNIDFFKVPGIMTEAAEFDSFYTEFSTSPGDICRSLLPLVRCDFFISIPKSGLSQDYYSNTNIRSSRDKIKTLYNRRRKKKELQDGCILGNCRDLSVLVCSILWYKGIPSRVRSGFGMFFHPDKRFDHWIVEVLEKNGNRWRRIDPWMYQIQEELSILPDKYVSGFRNLKMDPLDMGDGFFLTGGEAWRACRRGEDDFNKFGTTQKGLSGEWFVWDNMIRDLFCLNRIEPLPWDCWGHMGREHRKNTEEQYIRLDALALALTDINTGIEGLETYGRYYSAEVMPWN